MYLDWIKIGSCLSVFCLQALADAEESATNNIASKAKKVQQLYLNQKKIEADVKARSGVASKCILIMISLKRNIYQEITGRRDVPNSNHPNKSREDSCLMSLFASILSNETGTNGWQIVLTEAKAIVI